MTSLSGLDVGVAWPKGCTNKPGYPLRYTQMVPQWPLAGQVARTDFGNACALLHAKMFPFLLGTNQHPIIVRLAVVYGVRCGVDVQHTPQGH